MAYLLHSGVRRDALLTSEAGRHLGKVSKASRLTLLTGSRKLEERKMAYLLHSGVRRDALPTSEAGRHLGKVSKASRLTLRPEAGREEDGLLTSFGSKARRLTYFGGEARGFALLRM